MRSRAIVSRLRVGLGVIMTGLVAGCGSQEPGGARPAAEGPAGDPAPGEAPASVRRGPLEFTARTALLASYPVRLRTTATVRNRGSAAAVLSLPDGCAVLVRVLTRAGEAKWDQAGAVACTEAIQEHTIQPGDSVVFETFSTAPAILGDSLPDDIYVLAAYLRPVGERPVVLAAGRAGLVVPRDAESMPPADTGTPAAGTATPQTAGPVRR